MEALSAYSDVHEVSSRYSVTERRKALIKHARQGEKLERMSRATYSILV